MNLNYKATFIPMDYLLTLVHIETTQSTVPLIVQLSECHIWNSGVDNELEMSFLTFLSS